MKPIERALLAMILAVGVTVASPALCKNEAAYSSSVATQFPVAFAQWRAKIPRRYRALQWAGFFRGDAMPILQVTLRGKPMLFLETCKPGRCAEEEADAVISPDGQQMLGIVVYHGRPFDVGLITANQKACLTAFAGSPHQNRC